MKARGMNRRDFLRIGGAGALGLTLGPLLPVIGKKAQATPPEPLLETAKNCIVLFLRGGVSHVDTFDVQRYEGVTPPGFDIQPYKPGIDWPYGLLPRLGEQLDRIALIRSLQVNQLNHGRAQYEIETLQPFNIAFLEEVPHFGTVVSKAFDPRIEDGFILPPFFYLGQAFEEFQVRAGFFPSIFSPLVILDVRGGMGYIEHPSDQFDRRLDLAYRLDGLRREPLRGIRLTAYDGFYQRAIPLVNNPILTEIFDISAELGRYGDNPFGAGCVVARNLMAANLGTRFVQVQMEGWDLHQDIYSEEEGAGMWSLCDTLDRAAASLIADLAATPGETPGKTLLDETLVLCMTEFGRTPQLNDDLGRDHYGDCFSVFLAGGGVMGGQAIGVTDGTEILDYGWSYDRSIRIEDIGVTLYSALGIDWTTTIESTPSGRPFRYIYEPSENYYHVIQELFPNV